MEEASCALWGAKSAPAVGVDSPNPHLFAKNNKVPKSVRDRISEESAGNYDPIAAVTTHKAWGTASNPVLVTCSDNEQYVIKGSQNGKMVYNEYVCGRLGNLLLAPVAWVRFVSIDPALKATGPLAHFGDGLALGSLRVPSSSERAGVQNVDVPQNRAGFAGLTILYSWLRANDHQLIYEEVPPGLVTSADHGHFFPNGPHWSAAYLQAEPDVLRDPYFSPCNLVAADFDPFWSVLSAITDDEIVKITSAPPSNWGVDSVERTAMAQYLISRRDKVKQAF